MSSTRQLSVNPNLATTGAGQVKTAPADPGKAVVIFGFPSCKTNGVYRVPAAPRALEEGRYAQAIEQADAALDIGAARCRTSGDIFE